MTDAPQLSELEALYSSLTSDERFDLLQELPAAAARGGEAMMRVLHVWILDAAGRELLSPLKEPE